MKLRCRCGNIFKALIDKKHGETVETSDAALCPSCGRRAEACHLTMAEVRRVYGGPNVSAYNGRYEYSIGGNSGGKVPRHTSQGF